MHKISMETVLLSKHARGILIMFVKDLKKMDPQDAFNLIPRPVDMQVIQ